MGQGKEMSDDNIQIAWHGIELCRQDSWNEGLSLLKGVAEIEDSQSELPSVFYSYLGYGLALCQHRYREGLKLCQHAVKVGFYEPDNYLNLARTRMLLDSRRAASSAVRKGLDVDQNHDGLLKLQHEMGVRRRPFIPFLRRQHPVNIMFGRLRHYLVTR